MTRKTKYASTSNRTHILCIFTIFLFLLASIIVVLHESSSIEQVQSPGSVDIIQDIKYQEKIQYPRTEDFTDASGIFDGTAYYAQMEKYLEDNARESAPDNLSVLNSFFQKSTQTFLADTEQSNSVFSPLSLYFTLSLMAEVTDGDSRQQILDCLGHTSIESLRSQASAVWHNNYRNNGLSSNITANALWLSDNLSFNEECLNLLAESYHASSYQVTMGSTAANQAYQQWLSNQTNGTLDNMLDHMCLDRQASLIITSTIYFHANWEEMFSKSNTAPSTFYGTQEVVSCEFMHHTFFSGRYFCNTQFTAVRQTLNDRHYFYYILPNEGIAIKDLLKDDEFLSFICAYQGAEKYENLQINLSVPKFDVVSDLMLSNGLKKLGIHDVFRARKADFSPVINSDDIAFVTAAQQAVRLTIDETGCTAGTVTAVTAGGSAPPKKEIDFVLNRPFLFLVTNTDGLPMFVGVVNQP